MQDSFIPTSTETSVAGNERRIYGTLGYTFRQNGKLPGCGLQDGWYASVGLDGTEGIIGAETFDGEFSVPFDDEQSAAAALHELKQA